MKSLLYFVAFLLGFWLIKSYLGILVAILCSLIVLCVILYNKRAQILTTLASQAYFIKGNKEKGEKLYKKAYKTGLMTPDCKISYSSYCLRENQFEKGKRLLNEVINSKRSSTEQKLGAKHNLAVVLWREGDIESAVKMLETVHAQAASTNTYGTLGVLYLERAKSNGNYEDALEFMKEAYEYNDSDKTIADNLGELYLYMKQYENAKEVYEKLMSQSFQTPMPYYNYAMVRKALGETDEAIKLLDTALTKRFTSVLTITKETVQNELDELNNAN